MMRLNLLIPLYALVISGAPISAAPIASTAAAVPVVTAATGAPEMPAYVAAAEPWVGDSAGGEQLLTASSHGYTTPADGAGEADGIADHLAFPAGLSDAGSVAVQLAGPEGWRRTAEPSLGVLGLANADRKFDAWADAAWGRRARVWVGPQQWDGPSFGQFTRRLMGTGKGAKVEGDRVVVELRGRDELHRLLNAAVYGGFGNAIRLPGSGGAFIDSQGAFTSFAHHEVGRSSFAVRIRLRRLRATGSVALVQKGPVSGGSRRGWGFWWNATAARFELLMTDTGGTDYDVLAAKTPVPDRWCWVDAWAVVDRAAAEARIYLDGVLVAEQSITGMGSLESASLAAPFRIGATEAGGSLLRSDVDEVCLLMRAPTGDEIRRLVGRPCPDDMAGAVGVYHFDEGGGTDVFNSAARPGPQYARVTLETSVAWPSTWASGPSGFVIDTYGWSDLDLPGPIAWVMRAAGGYAELDVTASGTISWTLFDGVNAATASWSPGVGADSLEIPRRIAGEVDPAAGVIRLYVDGVAVDEEPIGAVAATGYGDDVIFAPQGALSGPYAGVVVDVRLWDGTRTAKQHLADAFREISGYEAGILLYSKLGSGPAAGPFPNLAANPLIGAGVIGGAGGGTVQLGTSDLVLVGSGHSWVGSCEGPPALRGRLRRRCCGIRRRLEGDLVDPQRVVYEVNGLPSRSAVPFLAGDDSLTYAGNVTDVYEWTSAAGQYVTCLDADGRTLVRMHALPTVPVAFDVEGDTRRGYTAIGAELIRNIAYDAGMLPGEVDGGAIAAVAAARPGPVGVTTHREPRTAAELITELAETLDLWWLVDPRTGILTLGIVGEYQLPAQVSIGVHDVRPSGSVRRYQAGRVVSQHRVLFRPREVTLSSQDVAGALGPEERVAAMEAADVVESRALGDDVLARHSDAEPREVRTAWDLVEDALADGERRQSRDEIVQALWEIPLEAVSYRIAAGITVLVDLPIAGLDGGRPLIAAGYSEDGQGGMTAWLWGALHPEDDPA